MVKKYATTLFASTEPNHSVRIIISYYSMTRLEREQILGMFGLCQSVEEQVATITTTETETETPVIGASVSETKATLLEREKMIADVLTNITPEQSAIIAKFEMQRKRGEALKFIGKEFPQLQFKRDRNQIVSAVTFRRRQEDKEGIKNAIRQEAKEKGYSPEREP